MKGKFYAILKTLGVPASLTAVIIAVLYGMGVDPEQIALIAGGLVGVPALVFLLIDVLKWAGVINDGIAGKLSAVFHFAIYAALVVQFKLHPTFDVLAFDAKVFEFVNMAVIVFGYITSLVTTKQFHVYTVKSIGISEFSLSAK